jgi:mono/diheme cytochrome c family protein
VKFVVALALALVALALVAAGCGSDDGDDAGATSTATETAPPTDTDGTATTDEPVEGDVARGGELFASAGCGGCHTLEAAGTTGSVGPNLDDASPSYDKVVERVTNGQGVMPSFKDDLTSQEIQDVAAYVSSSVD